MIGWGGTAKMPPGVIVHFHDEAVPRISRSIVRIWNSGNAILEKSQVAPSDPIRINLLSPTSKILYFAPIKESNKASNIQILESDTEFGTLEIAFDYLDPGDGVAIGILHTDYCPWPNIAGSIKGSQIHEPNRKWVYFKPLQRSMLKAAKAAPHLILASGLLAIGIAASPLQLNNRESMNAQELVVKDDSDKGRIILLSIGILYSLLGAVTIYSRRPPFPKSLIIEKKSSSKNREEDNDGPISVLEE